MAPSRRRWWQVARVGLLWGAGAVFIALVGLDEALQKRQIITGVISGGHLLLLMVALGAGVLAARRPTGFGPGGQVASAALAGLIAGLLVALLVMLGTVVNLLIFHDTATT